jgi:hypothetical protein
MTRDLQRSGLIASGLSAPLPRPPAERKHKLDLRRPL